MIYFRENVISFLWNLKNNKLKAILHCNKGVHRSATFFYSLLRLNGLLKNDAMKILYYIRNKAFNHIGRERINWAEKFII